MPLIDVIVPVKDAEDTLLAAVESILWQTERDISVILVNDGSNADTYRILDELSGRERVTVINSSGTGIVDALNTGISSSSSKYIARMDSDDISLPDRFEAQLAYFKSHPRSVLCGTGVIRFGDECNIPRLLHKSDDCKNALNLFNPFYHPTVMFKRDVIHRLGHAYESAYPIAQDFRFFSKVALVGEVGNIERPLLFYRVHSGQVTVAKRDLQNRAAFAIAVANQRQLTGKDIAEDLTALPYLLRTGLQLPPKIRRRAANALKNHLSAMLRGQRRHVATVAHV